MSENADTSTATPKICVECYKNLFENIPNLFRTNKRSKSPKC